MKADIHLEDRAGSSQGKHEGEPSLGLCDRLNRTRDNSQRQLPTDHDYAVPTREYQTDQSSLKTAPTAARSVFGRTNKQQQRPKQTHISAVLTRSLHIRPSHSSTRHARHKSPIPTRVGDHRAVQSTLLAPHLSQLGTMRSVDARTA